MSDEEERILQAWMVEGKNPAYHRAQKERLRREWPTLYQAIQALLETSRGRS